MLTFKDLSNNKEYQSEINNCVVVALMEVTSEDFDFKTINFFVKHVMNRLKNGTVFFNEIVKAKKVFKNIGLDHKKMKLASNETIDSFSIKNRDGRFLLVVDGHMMAMIDGCIHDVGFVDVKQPIILAIKV